MLARIRKSMDNKDEGFTLIELLVVIIIIGILAAIAIPVFLNQRKKGYDAAVKSDLRNAATAEETNLTDAGVYSTDFSATGLQTAGFKPTSNVTITGKVSTNASDWYCMTGVNSKGGQTWYYDSQNGGLQPAGSAKPANC